MDLVSNSGSISFNFIVSLNGGDSQCYTINPATVTGSTTSIDVSFTDDSSHWISDFTVTFLIGSTLYAFAGGNNCGGWTTVSSWPTTFDTAPISSGICNSFRNILNVAAGFTGQIQLNGYSTSTPLGAGVAPFSACSIPFSVFSSLNFGSGDVNTSGSSMKTLTKRAARSDRQKLLDLTVACGIASAEETYATVTCPTSYLIQTITFASYGTPTGSCGSFVVVSSCNAPSSVSYVSSQCTGRQTCSILASNSIFPDPCSGVGKIMYIQVGCVGPPTAVPTATPSMKPTKRPTATPTAMPTASPSATPTAIPTARPTASPSATPTVLPTVKPSATPTATPTGPPTTSPTAFPTVIPTATPSMKPTKRPTGPPTTSPTAFPTVIPT
eukprot:gene35185-45570_t